MKSKFLNVVKSLFDSEEYYGDDSHIHDILNEYKNKRHRYEEFRVVAHKTINAILRESNFKYQILSRTKTLETLKEKLLRKKMENINYHDLDEIEDLVGIRIMFYTEQDKDRFVKKLKKEIGDFLKIEERKKENGYRATHIIMSFGPKRLQLSEYKQFSGLKSEIQITSILHHTWAEIEHDLIYKDINGLKERHPEKFELMKKEMKEILEKYIEKASQELEEIIEKNNQ